MPNLCFSVLMFFNLSCFRDIYKPTSFFDYDCVVFLPKHVFATQWFLSKLAQGAVVGITYCQFVCGFLDILIGKLYTENEKCVWSSPLLNSLPVLPNRLNNQHAHTLVRTPTKDGQLCFKPSTFIFHKKESFKKFRYLVMWRSVISTVLYWSRWDHCRAEIDDIAAIDTEYSGCVQTSTPIERTNNLAHLQFAYYKTRWTEKDQKI